MTSSRIRLIDFSVAVMPFVIILASMVLVESICHVYLPAEPDSLVNHHLFVEAAIALLASSLIAAFILRTRKMSGELKSMELLKVADDWEKTFNTMTDFVSVHDKDFRVVRVNQALCDFLGREPEDILGKFCYQVFHDSEEPYAHCLQRKMAKVNHSVTEIINDPYLAVPLQITCSPLSDKGEFQGTVHIARVVEKSAARRKKPDEMIPICASCKSIRNGPESWMPPEEYFIKHCDSRFTHTICKDCQKKLYPRIY